MTPDEVRTFVRRHLERFHELDAAALATEHAVDGPRNGSRSETALSPVIRFGHHYSEQQW